MVIVLLQTSCAPTKCVMCDLDNHTIYNVELKDGAMGAGEKTKYLSYFPPVRIEKNNQKVELHVIDCEGKEPYLITDKNEMKQFILDNEKVIMADSVTINRITMSSDADMYPQSDTQKLGNLGMCTRQRNGFKVELRGMLGFRSFQSSPFSVLLGDTPIDKDIFGFGPQGTMITPGLEIGLLVPIFKIDGKHRFHLGIMSGFWPVEGGQFIPIAAHARFTFNDITSPIWGKCNAFYFFGDFGTAYNVKGDSDMFRYNKKFNSGFWDVGAGVDLWKSRKMDLSIDAGYRVTSLVLPLTNKCVLDDAGYKEVLPASFNPYDKRVASQIFIRVGITF